MELPLSLRRIIREQARYSVLRGLARGVVPQRVHVICRPSSAGWMMEVRFTLVTSDPRDARPLLVDGSGIPMQVERISCTTATHQELANNVWTLRLIKGGSWEGVVLECRLRARQGAAECIAVPDHLPQIVSLNESGPLPCVTVEETTDDLHVGGLAREGEAFGSGDLLQALIFRLRPRDSSDVSVHILGRLREEMSGGEQDRVTHLLSRILEFHASIFGVHAPARVLVAPAELVPGVGRGALLGISSIRAFGLLDQAEPDDVMLGSRLAGLWWGTACRITGKGGQELEAALRAAAGMLWADYVDGPYRGNIVQQWEQTAAVPILRDRWMGAQGLFMHALHARWSLALYEGLRESRVAAEALREVTTDSWGRFVTAVSVRSVLGKAGVILR